MEPGRSRLLLVLLASPFLVFSGRAMVLVYSLDAFRIGVRYNGRMDPRLGVERQF
jgi:hypothetical protein